MDGELISIILAIVLWLGAGFLGKVKDLAKKNQSIPTPSAAPSMPDEEEEVVEMPAQEVPAAPAASFDDMLKRMQELLQEVKEDSEELEERFEEVENNKLADETYETAAPASVHEEVVPAVSQQQEATPALSSEVPAESFHFDLRQALIHQTILENKYISDWK